jgi:membrane-bound lytic murein transglycosylase D
MRHHKTLLSSTGLVFTCLISGCQTLAPTGDLAIAQTRPASTHSSKASLSPSLKRLVETIQAQDREDAEARQSLESVESEISHATYDDVWERMRQGFRLEPNTHTRISRELRHYRKQSNYIELIQERSRPYIHFILNELEKRDMPLEIALLPAIESTYHPFAYSSGRAMGLWQFIPSTGRSFGLKQNNWYDGRRDVVASTRAALEYLKRLNEFFDGDWELALAAYNAGAGTVQRAMRKNKAHGKPSDYWSLQLPKETSRYVPRLLALSRIFAAPEKYGLTLQKIPDEPYFQTVNLDTPINLKLAARLADLSLDELQLLNPGYKRLVTPPGGPHKLLLPLDKTQGFRTQLAELPQEKRVQWAHYKIRKGDSLSQIALHHNVSVTTLKEANNLQTNTILVGQRLVIPNTTDQSVGSKLRNRNKRRDSTPQQYVVKKGDSLWSIAQAHKVNHLMLAKWNNLNVDTHLQPGQKLIIRTSNSTGDLLSAANLDTVPQPSQVSYEVKKGDSLYRIAERFSVTIPELKKWNSLPDELLMPGQRIKLYVNAELRTL